jgi:hypothetical protein
MCSLFVIRLVLGKLHTKFGSNRGGGKCMYRTSQPGLIKIFIGNKIVAESDYVGPTKIAIDDISLASGVYEIKAFKQDNTCCYADAKGQNIISAMNRREAETRSFLQS